MTASAVQTPHAVSEEDRLRADLYNFLGLILAGPPDELLLAQTAGLTGDDTDLGRAVARLADCARTTQPKQAEKEFNALFIGLGRGELLPYASFYLTGFLHEKPLAILRNDLSARRIERVLWNDPATGVMRHADAGYQEAIDCAREHDLRLPGILGS